jgi:hypothetical protein
MKKHAIKSKTIAANVFLAGIAPFIPAAREFIESNPQTALLIVALINILLRRLSNSAIRFF